MKHRQNLIAGLTGVGLALSASAALAVPAAASHVIPASSAALADTTHAPARLSSPRVIVVKGTSAAFASPTGNLVCSVNGTRRGGSIRCEALQHSWRVPSKPKSCDLDYGAGLTLDRGRGALLCAGDTVREAAQLSRKPATAWFSSRRDVVVRGRDGLGAMAGLRYGATLRVGAMQCTSGTGGVTCRNLVTGHGFWMSRAAYRTW